jgi:shikimate 5-dehydrogenase
MTTQTQNKRKQTSMPQVGFESTIPMFERKMTVDALDRAATVIGIVNCSLTENFLGPLSGSTD